MKANALLNTVSPTGDDLKAWADGILTAIADGEDWAEYVWESGRDEATFPDVFPAILPELTMSHDPGDEWGSVLGAFFPIAETLEAIGYAYDSPSRIYSPPREWGFRSGAAGPVWESRDIPGDDAWERIATVANEAMDTLSPRFDEWCVEYDQSFLAVDMASILSTLTGAPIGAFPDAEDEAWEALVAILLAAGWCLDRAADTVRDAGLDY